MSGTLFQRSIGCLIELTPGSNMSDDSKNYKIKITVNNLEVEAILNSSEMSRDFMSLLPLDLTMKDLFCREKFASLPRSISIDVNYLSCRNKNWTTGCDYPWRNGWTNGKDVWSVWDIGRPGSQCCGVCNWSTGRHECQRVYDWSHCAGLVMMAIKVNIKRTLNKGLW